MMNKCVYSIRRGSFLEPLFFMGNDMAEIDDIINRLSKLIDGSVKPKLRATFDGRNFNVTDGENLYGSFGAQSGFSQYQGKEYTGIGGKGPIPEGNWLLKYSDVEDFDIPYKENPKFLNSWGRRRVKLTPTMSKKDRFYRDGFYLHGSYNGKGSAGCIDLGREMPGLSRIIDAYGDDIPVEVKYDKENW